jgi:hypothetical protein
LDLFSRAMCGRQSRSEPRPEADSGGSLPDATPAGISNSWSARLSLLRRGWPTSYDCTPSGACIMAYVGWLDGNWVDIATLAVAILTPS